MAETKLSSRPNRTKEICLEDLLVLSAEAGRCFTEHPGEARFRGMTRPLRPTETRALAWFQSAVMVLNSKGALKPGWLEEFKVPLEVPDSDPECEFQDWTSAEPIK
jgi:hypothetical protein